jgi:hypothetical protein
MKTKIARPQVISALLGTMLIASARANEGLSIPSALPAPNEITTKGPDGQVASWYTELRLTPEEVQKVKDKNARVCYETVTDSEWDQANLRGFKAAAESLNMKVVATANAQLNPTNQKNNMENFVANCTNFLLTFRVPSLKFCRSPLAVGTVLSINPK